MPLAASLRCKARNRPAEVNNLPEEATSSRLGVRADYVIRTFKYIGQTCTVPPLDISWYEETRDSGTNFFFEQLPAGEYTFKYSLRANMAGVFRVSPATVQSIYAPEFAAYSAGAVLTIR